MKVAGAHWTPTLRIGDSRRSEGGATTERPVKGRQGHRSRRRTEPAHRSTAMAVENEGQVPEHVQTGFGNTDGNAGENPAHVSRCGHSRMIPATPLRFARGTPGGNPGNALGWQDPVEIRVTPSPADRPGTTSPVQAQSVTSGFWGVTFDRSPPAGQCVSTSHCSFNASAPATARPSGRDRTGPAAN